MTKRELIPRDQALPTSKEVGPQHEVLARSPRVQVFGTRIGGVYELSDELQAFFEKQGVPDVRVGATKWTHSIDDAFFGALAARRQSPALPAAEEHQPKTSKLDGLRRLLGRSTLGEASLPTVATAPSESEIPVNTLPSGVIVLPEMRQEGPTGGGMTIDTPVDYIQALCEKHGVPMVIVQNPNDIQELTQAARKLLPE